MNARLLVIFVAGAACTDVDLILVTPQTTVNIEGRYCATDPEAVVFPVKILFALDDSGSMGPDADKSDPGFRRLVAARELVEQLSDDPNILFAVSKFHRDGADLLTVDPVYTRDPTTLEAALAEDAHAPKGNTPYTDVLRLAITTIAADVQADPAAGRRTRYVVLLLSDGVPNCEDCGDEPFELIQDLAGQLIALESGTVSAGDVTLHTAYLQDGDYENDMATRLLSTLADIGEGEFRSFPNGDAIDFRDFDVGAITRDYHPFFPVLVSNANVAVTAGAILVDSDGDGLSDSRERRLGTDPTRIDTDGDGCNDLVEVVYTLSDPTTHGDETSPRHCTCSEDERLSDRDGDGLTDCEELLLALDPLSPDSDVDAEGNPAPDGMLDPYEVIWGLGRVQADAGDNYDSDASSNLDELATHMDPISADGTMRDEYAYSYSSIRQSRSDPRCFDFVVTNVRVLETLATEENEAGDNRIELYFVEAPQDNPLRERTVRAAEKIVRFDGRRATPATVTVAPGEFRELEPHVVEPAIREPSGTIVVASPTDDASDEEARVIARARGCAQIHGGGWLAVVALLRGRRRRG